MGIADYSSAAWQKSQSDAQIKKAILEGIQAVRGGKKVEMSAYKDRLSPEQVDALVSYVRALAK